MSGHSKWSQIKHKKGSSDQKKGQLFSRLSKKISIAVRDGLDPDTNYKLQAIINEAKAVNMPKDNIDRAIKKAGDKNNSDLKEVVIQAIGPGSIAIIIEAVSDNSNRTIGDIKNILTKKGAKLAETNSLDWMFDRKGVTTIEPSDNTAPRASAVSNSLSESDELGLIEAGAEDIKIEDGQIIIVSPPETLGDIRKKTEELGFVIEHSRFSFVPKNKVTITNAETRRGLEKLFEELYGHDDVEDIYSNLENL